MQRKRFTCFSSKEYIVIVVAKCFIPECNEQQRLQPVQNLPDHGLSKSSPPREQVNNPVEELAPMRTGEQFCDTILSNSSPKDGKTCAAPSARSQSACRNKLRPPFRVLLRHNPERERERSRPTKLQLVIHLKSTEIEGMCCLTVCCRYLKPSCSRGMKLAAGHVDYSEAAT
ncbi:hypothetical protein RJ639_004182 [Escallonia herrerae]|uniref:Uncharacterized protein n=1 Tax=Escallonia herrerae TaxID=1293975 RepID=A0AA89AWQ0_9ASTE|nr:hypothetical protein RJ639_004182 [Escallonia herrerae]